MTSLLDFLYISLHRILSDGGPTAYGFDQFFRNPIIIARSESGTISGMSSRICLKMY